MRAARDEDGNYYTVPSDMTYREWEKQYIKDGSEIVQNYKPVTTKPYHSEERGKVIIPLSKVTSTNNDIYVSDNVSLKPKQMHFIDKNVSEAVEAVEAKDSKSLPKVYVITNKEMQTGAMAAYSPKNNIIYIDESAGIKSKLLELQKECACPNNPNSTYLHEFIHWKDFDEYKKIHGETINIDNYMAELNDKCKKMVDNLVKQEYNVNGISEYASKNYAKMKYDEVYTEYRVKQMLGGK